MGTLEKIHFIIPYRDRLEHWEQFHGAILKHSAGKYEPVFWLMEQAEGRGFNRGAMLNLGAEQVLAVDKYANIALHDVDMLPRERTRYDRGHFDFLHIATAASQFDYRMPYGDYFGGVVLTTPLNMLSVGGFPMDFWGWGGEDDAFYHRVRAKTTKYGHRLNQLFDSLQHNRAILRSEHSKNVAILEQITSGNLMAGGCILNTESWDVKRVGYLCENHFLCTPK
jgi:hypothetical protein